MKLCLMRNGRKCPILEVPRNSLKGKSWTPLADSNELLPLKKLGIYLFN